MKLSEQSLRNWIDTKLNIKEISEQLTMSGLEVEDIQSYMKKFEKIFVGEVISVKSHSHINSFVITQINIGKKIVTVICNSHTIKKNMKVFIACIGTKLLNNRIVENININGIISEGIICTFCDLGFINNENKIIILPPSTKIGLCIVDYIFYKDKIIKINTTFNRVDVLGSFGIARDLSILNNLPKPKIMHINTPITLMEDCKIFIENGNMVYSVFGRLIRNLNLKRKTPIWMQEKLRKYEINSVNVVVDIINYVFKELGQSLYVFGFLGNKYDITISCKNNNACFINNKNIIFNNKIIVIKHKNQVISFLGNIDFNSFPIDLNNTNLFIGSFFIDPSFVSNSIYYTKLKHHVPLKEYCVDPMLQQQVIEYTTNLLLKICGGNASKITHIQSDNYYDYLYRKIKLYYNHVIKIVGYNITYNIIEEILVRSGYKIILRENFWYVIPPSWRPDILISEDVVSDIIRIYQYNKILSIPLISSNIFLKHNKLENLLKRVKYTLIDRGYYEVINYSFIDPKIQSFFDIKKQCLSLINPISKDMSCMRLSLWPGLIKTLLYHQNRQHNEVQFFESGLCFIPNKSNNLGVDQNLYFSGIIGNINSNKYHWDIPAKCFDFYDLKGDIEAIFDSIGYSENITFKKKTISGLNVLNSVEIIFGNQTIGSMGELDPFLMKEFNVKYSTFLFELFWYKLDFKNRFFIQKISEFPHSVRDISFVIDEDLLVGDIVICCQKQIVIDTCKIYISDIYNGNTIISGKKSVTLTFVFQSTHMTLTDNYINCIMDCCIQYLQNTFNAVLR
ncbi:Phenylalanine--tRNA ligase beta subunit [Buchnera aphidicola (Takecallis arundicolens)]|uniref:phenylalanine--tRNA ligase subunit beta n=1 Tax=Buchnera aphidicola TaxID=9 RepID=UPI003464B8D3